MEYDTLTEYRGWPKGGGRSGLSGSTYGSLVTTITVYGRCLIMYETSRTLAGLALAVGLIRVGEDLITAERQCRLRRGEFMLRTNYEPLHSLHQVCKLETFVAPNVPSPG